MIGNKWLVYFHTFSQNKGDSNKYPQHPFLGRLSAIYLNTSMYLSHLELRIHSIQIVVVTHFVVISNVGLKRVNFIIYK